MQQLEEQTEAAGQKASPAYISYSTFVTFLDWLKDMPAIPTQIDRSLWQGKFAGSTGAQLMAGLRFLNLLDGDRPRSELQELVNADRSKRKELIQNLLRKAYGDDLVLNLATKTPRMVDDRLIALGTSTTTHKKAVSFFVNAARDSDLTVPSIIGKQSRNRQTKPRSIRPKGEQGQIEKNPPPGGGAGSDGQGQTDTRNRGNFNLHMAVVAMLQDLETLAPNWSEPERNRWLNTFQVTLDYAYPIAEESEEYDELDQSERAEVTRLE